MVQEAILMESRSAVLILSRLAMSTGNLGRHGTRGTNWAHDCTPSGPVDVVQLATHCGEQQHFWGVVADLFLSYILPDLI
jgi:hypothetical protein